MGTTDALEYDTYYHIYNRGINGADLFRHEEDYLRFLRLYDEYIGHVAETFAWCLMKNHFHFLVRILAEDEIQYMKPKESDKRVFGEKKKYNPSRQFAHLFDAHAKAFNSKYERTGGLFETPFKRLKIDDESYFKHAVFYIHNNPVKHGFAENLIDYPWTSYLTIISVKPTRLQREKVLGWFNSKAEFIEFHTTS